MAAGFKVTWISWNCEIKPLLNKMKDKIGSTPYYASAQEHVSQA